MTTATAMGKAADGAGAGAGADGARRPPLVVILLLLVLVQVAFGGYGIVLQAFAKNAHADSLVFSMLRDAFCAPVLFLAALAFERTLVLPRYRELPFLFLLGLLGMFGNQYFYIQGLYFSTPNIASIFQPCIPVFTAFFAFLICIEPLPTKSRAYQWLKILGILLGAGGAIVMTLGKPDPIPSQVLLRHFGDAACQAKNATDKFKTGTCFNTTQETYDFGAQTPFFKLSCVDVANSSGFLVQVKTFADDGCKHDNGTFLAANQTLCLDRTTISCAHPSAASQLLGIIFLLLNCSCMAIYVLLQKRFVFGRSDFAKQDPLSLARWHKYPVFLTAYSYMFGAVIMAGTAAVRYAIDQDASVFAIPRETFAGLGYAVFVSSALAYGLISYCNKYVSSIVVTSFWPVQVFVTVILSYFVFGDELADPEYAGMALIMLGMFAVSFGNYREMRPGETETQQLLINKEI